MKIKIAQKLRPFSHTPGATCLIPGTCIPVAAYPTLLRIGAHEIPLPLTGPVKDFTLQQDLEKDCVYVFGKAPQGYFKLRLYATNSSFHLRREKGPLKDLEIPHEFFFQIKANPERLSLGNHKSQDWDLIKKRCDLKEILPLLFLLGQKIPVIPPQPLKGTAHLLELSPGKTLFGLECLFKAAFTQMLIPRLTDDQHQGLAPTEPAAGDPCFLLQETYKLIRSLFFHQNERRLAILPNCPFDAGRLIHLKAPGIGEIDLEWTKKKPRLIHIHASTSGDALLELPQEIKTYRVNKSHRQKRGEPLRLTAGKTTFLDRFEK